MTASITLIRRKRQFRLIKPLQANSKMVTSVPELAQRIQRLEQAVFPTRELKEARPGTLPSNAELAKTPNSDLSNQDEEQQLTSQWLEDLLSAGPRPFHLRRRHFQPSCATSQPTAMLKMLLDHFIITIDATCRTLHIPTTWKQLKELYDDLTANRLPSATRLAFFLGIFAGGAYISKSTVSFETVALQPYSQIALAELWTKQAVELVTTPPIPPSTEALQTIMNLVYLCTQIEGISGSFGILSMSGIQMAKIMKIHRLDSSPYREERRKNGSDMVDLEVKRRIWLLSYVGGPNEGTYMLHPAQMETNHPSNVEDDNIPSGITFCSEESYSLPLSSPTSMTYFLCRIQAATLAREVVDRLPPSFLASPGSEICDKVYDSIVFLDLKFQHFLKSLPSFFQLTISDVNTYQSLTSEKPYLEWQRHLINFVIHTQLARLHRPFLICGSMKHKFANSRMQCIKSAETVIEIRNRVIGDHSIGTFTYVLLHFLMAAIILAMDVCFNPDNIHVSQRKGDVLRACRELEAELNAKIIPSGTANGNTSGGQVMVKSFSKGRAKPAGDFEKENQRKQSK
ncbi:hypothetical protein FQN49_006259 [Arthroderma sp. PD_2]|nr:hypothetical protein FQN49_006259 [Arthroderma sp. PD_2]